MENRSKPRMYRTRLLMAKARRRMVRWILLRLFNFFVRITKRQLSLLLIREKATENPSMRSQLLSTNLSLPMALQTSRDREMLEDLQLLSLNMITRLYEET